MFGFWSGEEIGLLGSAAFVRAAPIPMNGIRAYLNFDMAETGFWLPAERAAQLPGYYMGCRARARAR